MSASEIPKVSPIWIAGIFDLDLWLVHRAGPVAWTGIIPRARMFIQDVSIGLRPDAPASFSCEANFEAENASRSKCLHPIGSVDPLDFRWLACDHWHCGRGVYLSEKFIHDVPLRSKRANRIGHCGVVCE